MEDVMTEGVASLEAKLLSLKADTMLVLGRLGKGHSNFDISVWGSVWNFTDSKIRTALDEAYAVFGLNSTEYTEDERRLKIVAYYREWQDHFLARRLIAPAQSTKDDKLIAVDEQGDMEMDVQESSPYTDTSSLSKKP